MIGQASSPDASAVNSLILRKSGDHKDKDHMITDSKISMSLTILEKPINHAATAVKGYSQEETDLPID